MSRRPLVVHFTGHILENRRLKSSSNLHDQMMLEAGPVVKYNWTDVAIHDRNKLTRIPVDHYCAWVVHELGSYLAPLYCRLDHKNRWESYPRSPIEILMMRWCTDTPVSECPSFASLSYKNASFYLIAKTNEHGGGNIIESSFDEFTDLVLHLYTANA